MKKFLFCSAFSLCLISGAQFALANPIVLNDSNTHDAGKTSINSPTWGTIDYTTFTKYGTPSNLDYSDAPSPYSQTGNDKGQWQGLGVSNGIDDGVRWSVGGSDFGTTADLIRGEDVTFKFLFWQSNNGRHTYDQIFAAFDFGQDGGWSQSGDTILYDKIDTINDRLLADDVDKSLSRYLEFTVSFEVPESMTIGTTWLRARAHCNHFLFGEITADNWINQGETEDYKLNIVNNPVPEPTTMLLFGTGITGLIAARRKKKN